jgi:GAF domain-containing protein
MTVLSEDELADLARKNAELEERLRSAVAERDAAVERQTAATLEQFRLQTELRAAHDRQKASIEILRSIATTSGNADYALQQIAETTQHFFNASSVTIRIAGGKDWIRTIAVGDASERIMATVPVEQLKIGGRSLPGFVVHENRQLHVPDLDNVDPSIADFPGIKPARAGGTRTMSGTPLRRGDRAIGVLIIHRDRLAPFTDEELALQQSFADQAVIAIENARLFNETQEALARQTATADVLNVISRSPTNVQPVFDAIVRTSVQLLGCDRAFVIRSDGNTFSPVAGATADGGPSVLAAPNQPVDPTLNFPSRAIATKKLLHVPDWTNVELPEHERAIREQFGANSALYLPLLRGENCIGVLALIGNRPNLFGEEELALAAAFRDQALIAIENTRLFNETQEALEHQTATGDILRVIASSPSDVTPVVDAIAESAKRLLGCHMATVTRVIDGVVHLAAGTAPSLAEQAATTGLPYPLSSGRIHARVARTGELAFRTDLDTEPGVPESVRAFARSQGYRSLLVVPMLRHGVAIGTIGITRREAGPFADKEIDLLKTFADQAVIAIENTRLFNETQEALERQTATADVLKVIASSPSDVKPVFEAIATRAKTLVGGFSSTVFRFIDGMAYLEAFTPTSPEADEFLKSTSPRPVADLMPFRLTQAGEVMQIPDTEALTDNIKDIARARGFRSMVFAPLMNEGASIGFIAVTRVQPGGFSDHHVQLLQTFADQAVIAIENTRLFDEVQAKTRDLEEALQVQTASADVLKVISRSPDTLQPVFDVIVETSRQLCRAQASTIFTLRDGRFYLAAFAGVQTEVLQYMKDHPISIEQRGSALARSVRERRTIHIPNTTEDPEFGAGSIIGMGDPRATLTVPLMREGQVIGGITLRQPNLTPFTQRQIEAIETFADQAVIAIENTRLFDEVQARTLELSESLQQQTATADVLKVISRSTFDLQAVLHTLVESAARLCGADQGTIARQKDGKFYRAESFGHSREFMDYVRDIPVALDRSTASGRALLEGDVVHIADVLADPEYTFNEAQRLSGLRTCIGVPVLREGVPVGVLSLTRSEVKPFSDKQIELVKTFADQAAIAIENARLFDEVQARTRELSKSLDDLRTAQDRLVQTEKLASLGQLTAGIAHEIKNPLNFVNNFSALSIDLTDELNDLLKQAALADKLRGEVGELTGLLKDNLSKVVQHGKRADSIVKNMLLHSREGSGEHRPADVNALVDESLNLAYHGARAEKPHFNVTLQRDFDPDAGMIEAFPQEITRVLLNLISNGFYAVTKRKADNSAVPFEPLVTATTKGASDHVEIRIRDNGTGIPPDVKEKMFNPFFTTKPAGEGTGLGLSMSHDIIVKQHGGTIDVETEPGVFAEFTIILPRTNKNKDSFR